MESSPDSQGSDSMALPRRLLAGASIAALLWVIAARLLGPSDVWHQTQPKTVAYTTDIIVHGGTHWILPVERGERPATKPPLYNWLAVPAVRLFGFASEFAHKLPSLVALVACWRLLVGLGNRLDDDGRRLGWLAGLCFVCGYTIFKLGYLARPDMLLTLWLLGAWIIATAVLCDARDRPRRLQAFAFWACVALAGLTKGPPALLALLYVAIAARVVGGSFRTLKRLHWSWGLPLCLAIVATWIYGVWRIDPGHLREELWFNEIYGRVSGQGPNVDHEGVLDWVRGLPTMPVYFLIRFAPWSIAAVLMMLWMVRRPESNAPRHWRTLPPRLRPWLLASALYVALIVVFFSLSTGKRADYIASAYGPGALLAGWWLLAGARRSGVRAPWLIPASAGLTLAALTVANQKQLDAKPAVPDFGADLGRFIDSARREIDARPAEVGFQWTLHTHLKAFLGYSEPDSLEKIESLAAAGAPFWVIAGRRYRGTRDFGQWYARRHPDIVFTPVVRSDAMPTDETIKTWVFNREWPGQVTLFRVEPTPPDPPDDTPPNPDP